MIEGLGSLLEDCDRPGLPELRNLLQELLGGRETEVGSVRQYPLKPCVYRLEFEMGSSVRFLIAKCMPPYAAQRNWLVGKRWLSAVGLGESGPPLLGVAADRSGQWVWHVYEDLGDCALDANNPHSDYVEAAVQSIAQVHTRCAEHPLLAECRLWGGDLGISFYTSNILDAIRCLEALQPPAVELSAARSALRDRWLTRLYKLREEQPCRSQLLVDYGGPETLLHGDLWTTNILVFLADGDLRVRLIDWDQAGVGPVSYDLSAFLYRFPKSHRQWILESYQQAIEWRLPAPRQLNMLFDTAERSRLTNRVLWAALGVLDGHAEWGFAELAAFDQWFEQLEPVLPL